MKRKTVLFLAVALMVPMLSQYLWKQHTEYVFYKAQDSKHAMDIEAYEENYKEKTEQDKKEIISKMVQRTSSLSERPFRIFFVWNVLLLGIIVAFKIQHRKEGWLVAAFLAGIAVYLCYWVGQLGMYLFSMPIEEAIRLASYDRYVYTILIYLLGIYVILLVLVSQRDNFARGVALSGVTVLLLLSSFFVGKLY